MADRNFRTRAPRWGHVSPMTVDELAKMALRAGLSDADDARFLEFIFDIRDALARDAKLPEGELQIADVRAVPQAGEPPPGPCLLQTSRNPLMKVGTITLGNFGQVTTPAATIQMSIHQAAWGITRTVAMMKTK